MSMQTDIIYGKGFVINASDSQMVNFIKKHADTVRQIPEGERILAWIEENEDAGYEDFKEEFSDIEDEFSGNSSAYSIVSSVIAKETGICFEYLAPQDEDEGDDVIIFPQLYPWEYNDFETVLTEATFDDICKKYIEDLGIHTNIEELRLEYFG